MAVLLGALHGRKALGRRRARARRRSGKRARVLVDSELRAALRRRELDSFSSEFGNFGSAQNPFMSETLAMVLQGVWMGNFIEKYGPSCAGQRRRFPSKGRRPAGRVRRHRHARDPEGRARTRESVVRVHRVRGAPELDGKGLSGAAQDFSAARGQRSVLRASTRTRTSACSRSSPRARAPRLMPRISIWNEYTHELRTRCSALWLAKRRRRHALGDVKARMQKSWDRARERRAISAVARARLPFSVRRSSALLVGRLDRDRRARGASGSARAAGSAQSVGARCAWGSRSFRRGRSGSGCSSLTR